MEEDQIESEVATAMLGMAAWQPEKLDGIGVLEDALCLRIYLVHQWLPCWPGIPHDYSAVSFSTAAADAVRGRGGRWLFALADL